MVFPGYRQSNLTIMQPSYWGFVETSGISLALIQSCLQGSLHFVNRRPTASERPAVVQGRHIFIYEESPSIQSWTDYRRWSPSRRLSDFLVYAELEPTLTRSPLLGRLVRKIGIIDCVGL